jgi:hypothetical protein
MSCNSEILTSPTYSLQAFRRGIWYDVTTCQNEEKFEIAKAELSRCKKLLDENPDAPLIFDRYRIVKETRIVKFIA